jgi:hypothetical protein
LEILRAGTNFGGVLRKKQGVSDKYSWVPQTFNGEGAALLWDDNYKKKPAYDSFLKAIQETPVNNGTAAAAAKK